MKKILILSASTGAGHVRAAEALLATVKKYAPDAEVRHIDIAHLLSRPARTLIVESYNKLAGRFPNAWEFLYKKTQEKKSLQQAAFFPNLIHRIDGTPIQKIVDQFQPDIIVSTHFLPALFLKTKTPIATVITDYGIHPFWLLGHSNAYFVSTDDMKQDMVAAGVSPVAIHVSGIPIHPSFYEKKIQKEALAEKVILVLSGGYGSKRTDHIVQTLFRLQEPATIISIAGKNKRLEQMLSRLTPPAHIHHRVIGWTDAIQDSMRIADVIIGKPGGLTVTECIALKKP